MDEQLDRMMSIAVNAAYVLLVVGMLLTIFPAARARLSAAAGQQAHAWRYGRWLASRAPAPGWTAQLGRDDLPAERSA